MNIGLLKRGVQFMASWRVNKMFKVPILIFRAKIAASRLLGFYFLLSRLIGDVYHKFLWNFLSELLQDVDLQTRIH